MEKWSGRKIKNYVDCDSVSSRGLMGDRIEALQNGVEALRQKLVSFDYFAAVPYLEQVFWPNDVATTALTKEPDTSEPAFWMIWSPQGGPPIVKHMTIDVAKEEAERLARVNPGKTFYLLRAVGKCERRDVAWTRIGESAAVENDIPF